MTDKREVRAVGLGAGIVGAYLAFVLASGKVDPGAFAELFLFYLGGSFGFWVFLVLCGAGYLIYSNWPRNGGVSVSPVHVLMGWAKDRWARDYMLGLAWPPLLFASLMASFNAFKQMILPAAGFRFDSLFAAMDRGLFLGRDPWQVTHALFGSPTATALIDKAYHGWFVPMALGVWACSFLPASTYKLRTQYLLSYVTVWIGIGSILAFLLPAAGPCFFGPFTGQGDFQPLLDRLAATQTAMGTPISALSFQQMLLEAHGSDTLMVGGGISAMPSVHNALAVLFAFSAFRIHRVAGYVMAAYAVLIWVGSIHLGWHYAIDGVVSGLLTWGIWIVAGRVADRLERPFGKASAIPVTA